MTGIQLKKGDVFLTRGKGWFSKVIRLAQMEKYPICSWVVACAFAKAGKMFGVNPGAASPDDIWDFVIENPDKYQYIHPLGELGE